MFSYSLYILEKDFGLNNNYKKMTYKDYHFPIVSY